MSADGADEGPEGIPYRLTLLRMIGAVMIRRRLSVGEIAGILEIDRVDFDHLLDGCIGGFSSSRLIAIRLTIEFMPLDDHGNPSPPEPSS